MCSANLILKIWCKITAIFLPIQNHVILWHSFCEKRKYSDNLSVFVTKSTKMLFCHIIKSDIIMSKLPSIMTALRSNLVFILTLPIFWLCFVLLYKPASMISILGMGKDMLHFNATIIMCILLGVITISRVLLMSIHRSLKLGWWKFFLWELSELLAMSMFMALYLTLMYRGTHTYFYMVGQCLFYLFITCIYPYIIFNLAFAYHSKLEENTLYDDSLMRFVDSTQKLKLMIASSAVLYIEADENYVHIRYMEGEKQKDYPLRASMKSLEELMQKHGLIRCQRSYYINPQHIKVLRRDKEGIISAELDVPNQKAIPVSPRYYDNLAKWL